jgi:hypothetical protein
MILSSTPGRINRLFSSLKRPTSPQNHPYSYSKFIEKILSDLKRPGLEAVLSKPSTANAKNE